MSVAITDLTVFISYASEQEGLAREIAAALDAVGGVRAIIDKSDVAAGDEVAVRLRELLLQADELVLLCSKEALVSPWVMLEVGAAYGLGRRVVPILIDLGINDLSQTLSHRSALRQDQLTAYYEQVARRADDLGRPGVAPERAFPFVDGERVVVRGPSGGEDAREDIGWRRDMRQFVGSPAMVTRVMRADAAVFLDVDHEQHWWAVEWLESAR